jgi:hypothetical protein
MRNSTRLARSAATVTLGAAVSLAAAACGSDADADGTTCKIAAG